MIRAACHRDGLCLDYLEDAIGPERVDDSVDLTRRAAHLNHKMLGPDIERASAEDVHDLKGLRALFGADCDLDERQNAVDRVGLGDVIDPEAVDDLVEV